MTGFEIGTLVVIFVSIVVLVIVSYQVGHTEGYAKALPVGFEHGSRATAEEANKWIEENVDMAEVARRQIRLQKFNKGENK